jgi:hypothetical protein
MRRFTSHAPAWEQSLQQPVKLVDIKVATQHPFRVPDDGEPDLDVGVIQQFDVVIVDGVVFPGGYGASLGKATFEQGCDATSARAVVSGGHGSGSDG